MRDAAIARARWLIAGLIAAPLVTLAVLRAISGEPGSLQFDMPAMLAGLVALPIGWHLHATLLDRGKQRTGESARIGVFLRAIIAAMAVTGLAALFGIIAYAQSHEAAPLTGVAMHVILGGVLWPSRERLDAYIDEPDAAPS